MIYTPENVIGATLPCGAKVVEAQWYDEAQPAEGITVDFDRSPSGQSVAHGFMFTTSGTHLYKVLPDLIPPAAARTPDQQQFWREVFLRQMGLGSGRAEDWAWHADEAVRVAIERGML